MPPNLERPAFHTPQENVHRSVRVFAVAPISADKLAFALRENSIDDIPLVEVILGKKPPTGPSANRLIAFGGGIEPGEAVEEAAIREFGEESTITALSTQRAMQDWRTYHETVKPFKYTPPKRPENQVYFLTLPIAGQDVQKYGVRGVLKDNMDDVVVLTPHEFTSLLEAGEVNGFKIVGHMSKQKNDHIRIKPEDERVKNEELDRIAGEIYAFERIVREKILQEVNTSRYFRALPGVDRLSECTPAEIRPAYIAAQMQMDLSCERQHERILAAAVRDGRDSDALRHTLSVSTQDPLKVAPYLSRENLLKHPELLLALPTETLVHQVNVIKRAVKQTLESTSFMQNGKNIFADLPWNSGLVKTIVAVQERLETLPADSRAVILSRLDTDMAGNFARLTGVAKEAVIEAVTEGGDLLFDDVTASMRRRFTVFQEHLAANEIEHSGLFGYVLMALRIHPELVEPMNDALEVTKKMQYEAIRELGLLFPAVRAIKEWHASTNDRLIDVLFAEFFGVPFEKEEVELDVDGKKVPHTIYHRRANLEIMGVFPHVIIDDRTKKSKVGLLRKYLLDNGPVHDNRSTNIVISDDNFRKKLNLEDRLQFAELLRDEMVKFFRKKLGSGWSVRIEWDAEDERYKNVRQYAALPQEERFAYIRDLVRAGGKRPGSQGYRFIRDQFRLVLEGHNTKLVREIDIYPFEDTHHKFTPDQLRNADLYWQKLQTYNSLSDNVFAWGWRQKLRDHTQGNYEAARYYVRSTRWKTEPSLYELLWASVYYYFLIERVRLHQVKK